jgi:hypothetical protein
MIPKLPACLVFLSVACAILGTSRPATAEVGSPLASSTTPESPGAERPPPSQSRWYGYQTLVADGPSVALGAVGFATHSSAISTAGLLGYALGGPIIHVAHGHVGKGVGDLALRLGAPAVAAAIGGLIGLTLYTPPPPPPPPTTLGEAIAAPVVSYFGPGAAFYEGAAYGVIAGAATAIAIDAAVLAREDAPATSAESTQKAATAIVVRPSFAPTKDGARVGLTGTF